MSAITGTNTPPVDQATTEATGQEDSSKITGKEALGIAGQIASAGQQIMGAGQQIAGGGVQEPGTGFVPEQPTLDKLAKQQQKRPDVVLPPDVQARRDQLCEKLGLPSTASNREIEIALRQEKQKMEIGGKYKGRSTGLDGNYGSSRNTKLEGLLAEKRAKAEAEGPVAQGEDGAEIDPETSEPVTLTDAKKDAEEKEVDEEQNQTDLEQQLAAQLSDRDKIKTV